MGLLAFLILGFLAALIAKAVMPGEEGMGFLMTLVVGIIGALVGGWLGGLLFDVDPMDGFFDISTWVAAILGSVVVIWVLHLVTGRRGDKTVL